MIIAMRWTVDGREYVRLPGGRYVPPIAGGKGGGKSTTTVAVPPKSEEELSVLRKQNDLLDLQIQELQRQNDALVEVFPQQKELLKAQTDVALSQVKLFQEASGMLGETPTQKKIREASEERSLAVLEGRAPQLAPDQERHIDELIAAEREAGQREITRFVGELAGERGLRARTDTPIAREGARAARELETGLRSTAARAKLDYGQANQVFAESTRQFQEELRQRSFQNRLAMLGSPAPSLPLFGTVNPTAALAGTTNVLDSLARERLAATTTATRSSKGSNPWGAILGIAGTAAGAYFGGPAGAMIGGQIGSQAGNAISTARLKKNILPLDDDEFGQAVRRKGGLPIGPGGVGPKRRPSMPLKEDEYDRALAKVRETPIVRYRYKWEGEDGRAPHIGPILELSPEEIREDSSHVNLLDYTGLVHAAVKAVDRKVTRLARRSLPLEAR